MIGRKGRLSILSFFAILFLHIGKIKIDKLKKERTIDEAKTEIVNKIIDEIKDLLHDQMQGGDSTDGVITLFEDIFQSVLEKFKKLIGETKDKRTLSVD